ncbi:MAG: tyrosine recombinase XerC [Bacteriovoracaceae bacterium]
MNNVAKSESTILFQDEFFENFTSEHTRHNYSIDIETFKLFYQQALGRKVEWGKVERIDIVQYRNWLSESGGRDGAPAAPKTVARKLASLSSYFHFLVERDILPYNPVTSVKRPRRDVQTPTNALNKDQVKELFQTIINSKSESRFMHLALLTTFFTTGLRKSEVLNLRFRDYREINDMKYIEFKGKGGKLGQKLIHPQCVEAIEQYLEWMKSKNRGHKNDDWLFQPTKNPTQKILNKPLNPRTINEIIDMYAKKMGLNFHICPHSARATFITELLDAGVDIYAVAREVNHSSVVTTQEYDKRRKKLQDSPVLKLRY